MITLTQLEGIKHLIMDARERKLAIAKEASGNPFVLNKNIQELQYTAQGYVDACKDILDALGGNTRQLTVAAIGRIDARPENSPC